MIVTCNECDSSFNVDDHLLKDTGSKVRCSKCSSVFVVYPETAAPELDQETDDLVLETNDELPDLEDMMDFDEEDLAMDSSGDEDSDALGLESDEENLFDMEESELGDLEAADTDLPDLDMDLDDLNEAVEADSPEVEPADDALAPGSGADSDELDLSDLEELVGADDDMELEGLASDDASDDDLEMDLDIESDEIEPAEIEAPVAEDVNEQLDMEDFEDLVGADTDTPVEEVVSEDADDLDLGLDLDSEPELESEPETASMAAALDAGTEESDELDLSDLEGIIEPEEEPSEEGQDAEALDDLNLDLDLDAQPAEEAPVSAVGEDPEAADELDFSDLEGIMDTDEPAETAAADDLELEFEVDEGAGEAKPAETADVSEELDLNDLEQMLESDEKPEAESADELELDLDLEPETAETADAAEPAGSDDAEFLDIEQMLEGDEDKASAAPASEEVVELDLEAVMDEASQPADSELELNLDLDTDQQEVETISESPSSGEEDLDFDLLDSDEETLQFGATQAAATQTQEDLSASAGLSATSEEFATEEFAETGDIYEQTGALDDMGADMGIAVKKRSARKPLIAVVLVLLLCLIGIIVTNNLGIKIPFVSDLHIPYISDVKIPYLSGLMGPKVEDTAGNLSITPMSRTISYKFVDNESAGRILVISGKVRNEYDHPRSNIKVTGKIYQKGKHLANSATVYAGNQLSDADLKRMDMAAINRRLQNRFGDKRSNIKVKTGTTIPFFIVFNQLPANLDEYTVEVAGSSS
ncbi:MAG: DUF3426 domain-containing protein [Desulfobacterales bacterium]